MMSPEAAEAIARREDADSAAGKLAQARATCRAKHLKGSPHLAGGVKGRGSEVDKHDDGCYCGSEIMVQSARTPSPSA
jgi:hypothetical protein